MRVGVGIVTALAALACWAGPTRGQSAGTGSQQGAPAAAGGASSAAASQPGAAMPEASFEDLTLLVKTARRAFQEKIEGLPEHAARYRPPTLSGVKGVIHLTLRSHGAALAEAESGEMDIVEAAVAAGTRLGQAVLEKKLKVRAGGEDMGLEFEWLGPREYLSAKYAETGRWSDELLHSFEPAGEGIGVEFRGKRGWTRPSQVVALNYTPDLALGAAESAVGLTHADKLRSEKEIWYFRFRSHHLWQPTEGVLPTVLVRGAAFVSQDAVDAQSLDAAIARMGDYLHYRQNRDGWFSQEYQPSPDKYGEGNSAVIQMKAIWGLAAYAVWSGQTEVIADAKKGISRDAYFLTPLSVVAGVGEQGQAQLSAAGLALVFPGYQHYLEISADLLLAFLDVAAYWRPDALAYQNPTSQPTTAAASAPFRPDITVDESMTGLILGLLAAQDQEGRMEMAFAMQSTSQPADLGAAGWALLALAKAHPWCTGRGGSSRPAEPGSSSVQLATRIERTLESAFPYYQRFCREPVDPQDAAILAWALVWAYACTNDARASDLAFTLLDEFARLQVDEAACPWPELRGAINARAPGLVGVDTADYLTALADGIGLAERVGEKERAKRYRDAVRAAARFVMQLEVREEGCYYIRSPRDALGGVRASPWDNRIRADHCARAVVSLMRARAALFGPPK